MHIVASYIGIVYQMDYLLCKDYGSKDVSYNIKILKVAMEPLHETKMPNFFGGDNFQH